MTVIAVARSISIISLYRTVVFHCSVFMALLIEKYFGIVGSRSLDKVNDVILVKAYMALYACIK